MKKRIWTILCCCFFLSIPAISFGASGWYGSINAGMGIVPDGDIDVTIVGEGSGTGELSYDAGFTLGGAIGYMMEQFRVEGEISYQANDIDNISGPGGSESLNGDVSALTFLANGYLDLATGGPLTPYITAGIGYSNVEADIEGGSDDDNLFTYQLGVGLGYAMSETVTLDLRYRYLGFEDYEYSDAEGSLSAEISSHNITAGLRFVF
jgi:opacity protein-like surface antigen